MTDSHAITTTAPTAMATRTHPLVEAAIRQGNLDPDTLQKMMGLQERFEANEAKKEFMSAMVQLKEKLPSVLDRDTRVKYGTTNYTHTSLGAAIQAITPILTEFGFSISWEPSTSDNMVSVTCRITHELGHSDQATLSAPPDMKGGKNAAQGVASTVTLLQRYTALALLGIATADMNEQDGQDDEDRIDATANLQAVAGLRQEGISIEDAQDHVGKDVRQWTTYDLSLLRELVKKEREQV